jgi:hypothetical protein
MNKLDPKQVIIENCTTFRKIVCTTCGSDNDLREIEMLTNDMKDQWETVLCLDCIKDIPSFDDLVNEEEQAI